MQAVDGGGAFDAGFATMQARVRERSVWEGFATMQAVDGAGPQEGGDRDDASRSWEGERSREGRDDASN